MPYKEASLTRLDAPQPESGLALLSPDRQYRLLAIADCQSPVSLPSEKLGLHRFMQQPS